MEILKNEYYDEDMLEIDEHIFYAIKQASLPKYENGFHQGKFIVTVEFVNDSE